MEQANGRASELWEFGTQRQGAAVTSSGPTVLPRGKVEMVFVVDEARRLDGPDGKKMRWRLSFEYAAFGYDEHGNARRDSQIIPRVRHCFGVLYRIMRKLVEFGFQPIYGRKESGDEFVIGLWRTPGNPRAALEVAGYPVSFFEVEHGEQCPHGFDEETMSVVTKVEEFRP